MTVVTRFAPSPTGYLHIGGARTALFSWLYARAKGGKFLLRIEDTDRERSTQPAIDAIFDAMDWLGLASDEPPMLQSTRADRHRQAALDLVARGAAYRCPVTPQELEARRSAAAALKHEKEINGALSDDERAALDAAREIMLRPFRSAWRDGARPIPADAPTVVRLRMPDEGEILVHDQVQGDVRLNARELDDLVLLRSDGTPTYMLAVVVDDHDMGVTHVIRGDDHLTNTFRQLPIYRAMGWPEPTYAHVPMIHGQDGKKLSKRHGALGVDAYRDLGYLPEGLKNYLLRLGWSHGDDEIIDEKQAVRWFDLDGLNKAPARLDIAKLDAVNAHYMTAADDARLGELLLARPEMANVGEAARQRIQRAIGALKGRAANLVELAAASEFLRDIRPIQLPERLAAKMDAEARGHIGALREVLSGLSEWDEPSLKAAIAQYCETKAIGLGKIGPILRAALTGGASAPDIALVLSLLGRNESLARLEDQAG